MNIPSLALWVALASGSTVALTATSASFAAETPSNQQQVGIYRFALGDFQIVALSDGTVPMDLHALLKGTTNERIDATLRNAFLVNPLEASVNAYLIDTGTRKILVDTGAGSLFGPDAGGRLIGNLRAAGYAPEQIDDILLTHLHTDHSGGLVDADGNRLFKNAVVHVGKADVDLFLDPTKQNGVPGYDKVYFQQATFCVTPYLRSGQLKTFEGAQELFPGIRSQPTPGHTPGHSFYTVESKGQSMTFVGDILHAQAIQMGEPAITIAFDFSQPDAAAQRKRQLAALTADRRMIAGAHLPYPGLGHVRAKGAAAYDYVPTDYRNR